MYVSSLYIENFYAYCIHTFVHISFIPAIVFYMSYFNKCIENEASFIRSLAVIIGNDR